MTDRIDKSTREELGAFARLIQRSADLGDGWRNVSNTLRKLVTAKSSLAPDLFELREVETGLQVRLSSDGEVVARYLP